MTAKDFLVEKNIFETSEIHPFNLVLYRDGHVETQKNIEKSMIEFARLKCEELLKIVVEKASVQESDKLVYKIFNVENSEELFLDIKIDKNSILNAVDLNEFIK